MDSIVMPHSEVSLRECRTYQYFAVAIGLRQTHSFYGVTNHTTAAQQSHMHSCSVRSCAFISVVSTLSSAATLVNKNGATASGLV